MQRESKDAINACYHLLYLLNNQNWDEARLLISDNFVAYWPQSNEKVSGSENFIEVNRNFPGTCKAQVLNSMCEYDQWEHQVNVSFEAQTKIRMPDGTETKCYAIYFFIVDWEPKILSFTEYLVNTCNPPEWRKKFTQELDEGATKFF